MSPCPPSAHELRFAVLRYAIRGGVTKAQGKNDELGCRKHASYLGLTRWPSALAQSALTPDLWAEPAKGKVYKEGLTLTFEKGLNITESRTFFTFVTQCEEND